MTTQTIEFESFSDIETLVVTMNHAPGRNADGQVNDFHLELFGPGGAGPRSDSLCDNGWKLVSVCRVESPAPGHWRARVSRIHGKGHFQLLATGISR